MLERLPKESCLDEKRQQVILEEQDFFKNWNSVHTSPSGSLPVPGQLHLNNQESALAAPGPREPFGKDGSLQVFIVHCRREHREKPQHRRLDSEYLHSKFNST